MLFILTLIFLATLGFGLLAFFVDNVYGLGLIAAGFLMLIALISATARHNNPL